MAVLQGTSGSGDAAWADDINVGSLRVPNIPAPVITNAAIPTLDATTSGTVYRVNAGGGTITIALPVAQVGIQYTFVMEDVTNDLTINTATVADNMLGVVAIMDDDGVTNSRAASADGDTHDRCLIDVSAGTVVVGSWVRFTALTATQWFVEGCVITGDGAQAAVVFSSN